MQLDTVAKSDYMPRNSPCDRVDGACQESAGSWPWFVIQTEPWCEFQACNRVAQLPGIKPWVVTEVYRRQLTRNGRPVFDGASRRTEQAFRSFFPGYLLASFDPDSPAWAPLLRRNPDLRTVRLFCDQAFRPLSLPLDAVTRLKALQRPGDGAIEWGATTLAAPLRKLAPGASVRLLEGCPFEGLTGTVGWTDQNRVQVLLGLLRVTVERRHVA